MLIGWPIWRQCQSEAWAWLMSVFSSSGIQPLTQAVTKVGEALGFEVRTQMGAQPKVYLRTTATSGEPLRIKVEVNTYERRPALPLHARGA